MRDLPGVPTLLLMLAAFLVFWVIVGLAVWEILWQIGVRPWA